ncbi:ABC transporter permease [Spirosoma sp. 48-14]|uniref:ABC transporter permease n=1 Tax=Spirosoma sp. 48-14 TaxID=1895854 RepID=UPI0009597408|nr:ABC transporter permease [Spirosoma sp. 48-14]OJW75673.1 MAG: hypothetical protein BGO59_08895 [Spirosoma sp. 48-14]
MINPLLTIAQFELRYQLRQPTFYLYVLMALGQGIWYSNQFTTVYAYMDTTQVVYLILSSLGVMLAVIATLLAGQSLTKDLDYRTTAYLFTLPITPRIYFAGRFLGTFATVLLLALFYPLGILLFLSFYNLNGPDVWLALLDGFVRLVAQNLLIAVSLPFAFTVFLRSMRGAYVSLFLVVLYFLLTESGQNIIGESDLGHLLDPFGVGMARESVESMTFSEQPAGFLVFSDLFLINRMLWLGLALGLLAYAEQRFSFDYFTAKQPDTKQKETQPVNQHQPNDLPTTIRLEFGARFVGPTILHLAKLELRNLARQPIFFITLGLLVLLSILSVTVLSGQQNFPTLPITSQMTALRLSMGVFIGLFLLVMTGELIFSERTVGFWPIHDALPQPNFVFLAAKLLAMIGIAAFLTLVLFLTGVAVQLASHFYDIDWMQYTDDLLMDGFLRYCQLIALGALIAVLVNNRLLSHLINLLIFAALFSSYQFHANGQLVYAYSFLPGSTTYSDLIGYGANSQLRPVMHRVWWSVAGLFITTFFLTWNRGVAGSFPDRIRQWSAGFQAPYNVAFGTLCVFLCLSVWQLKHQSPSLGDNQSTHLATQSTTFSSVSGRPVQIRLRHHHAYLTQHMLRSVRNALRNGEQIFGPYPYSQLQITETPLGTTEVGSRPGEIRIAENQGWTADYRKPTQLDYIDYLVSREVFKQWLVHRLHPVSQPGAGFLKQSLPEYLALQTVAKQYGSERLRDRLAQRAMWYANSRQRNRQQATSSLQSNGNDAVERGRAALALTSIEQIWGSRPLSLTIGQFYQKAIQEPSSATAVAFAQELSNQLPDQLKYLKTYLSEPLAFDFKVGHVANLPNGLTVEILTSKWREEPNGRRQPIPINDYIPLVVLDEAGHEVYRQLAHPNPDERFIALPPLPNARKVVIDPLGAWLEPNKRDNTKLL